MLRTENLSLHYQGNVQAALTGLYLQLSSGEIVAVAGESGSGKTTLLQALAGLMQPAGGSIFYKGLPLPGPDSRLVPGHPEIALAFQENRLLPMLSLRQNMQAYMRGFTPEYIDAQTELLLTLCRVARLGNNKPRELSGGERQRAALAAALSTHPQVLLLDEPFSNLDPPLKAEILTDLIDLLKVRGTAALLVTHDPADALSLADRIYLLQKGRLVQQGSPAELYNQPANAYAACFFGENNLLSASEARTLQESTGQVTLPFNPEPLPENGLFYIRPRHIVLSPAFGNILATLTGLRFYGHYYRAELLTDGGLHLVAHCPEKPAVISGQKTWLRLEKSPTPVG